ncbi:MAG: exodeoxyribonuclease V subunit alpha [Planctomycetota bacterium]
MNAAEVLGALLARRLLARAAEGSREAAGDAVRALVAAWAKGHTCLPIDELALCTERPDLEQELLSSGLVSTAPDADPRRPLVASRGRLYLRRFWRAETDLAKAIRARLASDPPAFASRALEVVGPEGRSPEDPQQQAVRRILGSPLSIVTGGPGTGKTTTVARAVQALVLAWPDARIALTAPTGKAKARLHEAVLAHLARAGLLPPSTLTAATMHRLLGYLPQTGDFRAGPDRPLPFDLVVVDEASMIDLEMMAILCAAVPPEAGLALLGDVDQLASVESGRVLADLCEAGGRLSACRVRLARQYRFPDRGALSRFTAAMSECRTQDALAALSRGGEDLTWSDLGRSAEDLLAPFADRLRAPRASLTQALSALSRFCVLCASHHGPFGADALNRAARRLCFPGAPCDRLLPGEPVLVTANDHVQGLYNGDLGAAWPDDAGRMRIWFEGTDGPRGFPPERLPRHEPAWAMTVHKSQGSEFAEVLLVLPPQDMPLLTAPLLYTAVTRARERAHVAARASILEAAIRRRETRASGLRDALAAGD